MIMRGRIFSLINKYIVHIDSFPHTYNIAMTNDWTMRDSIMHYELDCHVAPNSNYIVL